MPTPPNQNGGANKERYPGMRIFATNTFKSVPNSEHGALSRKMKYYLEMAKSQGIATQMNWADETLGSLVQKFGEMPSSHSTPPTTTNTITGIMNGNQRSPASVNDNTNKRSSVTGTLNSSSSVSVQIPSNKHTNTLEDKSILSGLRTTSSGNTLKRPAANAVEIEGTVGTKRRDISGYNSNNNTGNKLRTNNKAKQAERQARFSTGQNGSSAAPAPYVGQQIHGTVVGTSESLEKPYFRLTGQVNPAAVRPPHVLEKALEFVLKKYHTDESNYSYISSQLQSIRQDLTVQHIETALTLKVYEENARIALHHDDMGEFNKCLTRVTSLYEQDPELGPNRYEFKAYSIYYTLLLRKWDELSIILQTHYTYKCKWPPLLIGKKYKSGPPPSEYPPKWGEQKEMVDRALTLVHCVSQQNMVSIWQDTRGVWPLEHRLFDKIIERERVRGLEGLLVSTYQQSQKLRLFSIGNWLGLNVPETAEFLQKLGIPYERKAGVSSKAALPIVRALSRNYGVFDIKGQK